jgi:DNA-binding NarL/FixJ family response regulator
MWRLKDINRAAMMHPTSTLLVDDSPSFLESAVRFLSSDERVDVVGLALSGQEALERIQQLQPELVLIDLAMPGINGLEVTRRLKALPNAPWIVILTLHDTFEYRAAAAEAQADGFITKSEFGDKLLPLIEQFRSGAPLLPIDMQVAEPEPETGNRYRQREELAARLHGSLYQFTNALESAVKPCAS